MILKVHGFECSIDEIKQTLLNARPEDFVPILRSWILRGPPFSEFERLYKFLDDQTVAKKFVDKLPTERWAVIGGYTTRPITTTLKLIMVSFGINAEILDCNYDAFDNELFLETSDLYKFKPTHVLVCTGHHNLKTWPETYSSKDQFDEALQSSLRYFEMRWEAIQKHFPARILQHSLCLPHDPVLGRLEEKYFWSKRRFIRTLNEALWSKDGAEVSIVDVASLQDRIGTDRWWSSRWYNHGKLPFSPENIGEYGKLLYGHIAAMRGKTRKCISLDLDGTLWDGIIGDDGLDGIKLGNGTASGEEHLEFCNYLDTLNKTGIVLGVVSKNDPVIARSVFESHPAMPLKMNQFSSFKSGWGPKSESIREQAKELNIGLDSIVFIDDNPVECEEVARANPEVIVLQLINEKGGITESLESLRLFDRMNLTQEDLLRSESYEALNRTNLERTSATDITSFLADLKMMGEFREPRIGEIPRVSDLFQKTNQFKTSPKLFDQKFFEDLSVDQEHQCFVSTLTDKYANHGLVSAMVVKRTSSDQIEILNWVMSCRVFNRGLEDFMMGQLCQIFMDGGIRKVSIEFVKSPKNNYVDGLFERLGFLKAIKTSVGFKFEKNLDKEIASSKYTIQLSP